MHLACCQLGIVWEDKPANYGRVETLLAAAQLPPGTLLLLPEMFATGYTMRAEAVAEPPDGPTAHFLADLASRYQIWVQGGIAIQSVDSSRPRNEMLVFSPAGQLAARYAKIHLFSFVGEPEHYAPGESLAAWEWQGTSVAPAICYDLRFPELFRAAAIGGAEIFTVIACWPAAREEHWLALLRARAIENQGYVAAANRCGADPFGQAYSGRSQIIDPRGQILADAGSAAGVIQAEIDMEGLRRYRQEFPALRDIRLKPAYF
ncbi:MAG: carbon-nitrogen family hydrolase [Planctomycetota bacterium]|nr:carbon-nitrogen family hydrolase [Planctomycetota bacterium]